MINLFEENIECFHDLRVGKDFLNRTKNTNHKRIDLENLLNLRTAIGKIYI